MINLFAFIVEIVRIYRKSLNYDWILNETNLLLDYSDQNIRGYSSVGRASDF